MPAEINKFFTGNIVSSHTVFRRGDDAVSFGEFASDVARMANVFVQSDAGTVILFIPDDNYLFYVAFMGLMQAGKDVVLPAMLTARNVDTLRNLTDTIVTNQNLDFPGCQFIDITQDCGTTWNFCDMDNRKLYFFTSGSTGTPKQICKTFHNLTAEVAQHTIMQRDLFAQAPVLVASVAPYHMYGLLWRFLIPLAGGIAIDTSIIFTPEELQNAQRKFEKIVFITTPAFLDGIAKYQNQYEFMGNCVGIFSSGSLLATETSRKTFETFGVSPFEVFGSTETGGIAYRQQADGPLWTVFDNVTASVNESGCIIADSEFCCVRPYQMSDVVEMQDERRFLLKGRADRIVKIAEERVSLPEYEDKLCRHPFIESGYATTINQNGRVVIGCVVTLTDVGQQFIISNGRRAFISKIKNWLAEYFPGVTLPRRVRIVNAIPKNAQGKILNHDIAEILRSTVSDPIAQRLIKTDSMLSADFTFLGDCAYFQGHFPNCPILPGVIQLHFVIKYIRLFFNKNVREYDIIKLKFTNLILPDTLVHFELTRLSDDEYCFCYENGDVKYSAGKIVIKE